MRAFSDTFSDLSYTVNNAWNIWYVNKESTSFVSLKDNISRWSDRFRCMIEKVCHG